MAKRPVLELEKDNRMEPALTIALREKAAAALAKAWAMTDAPQAVTIVRPGSSTYDPATGKTVTTAPTSYPATAIVTNYGQREIDGTAIKATDRKVLIPQSQVAAAGTITTSDKLTIGTKTYSIIPPVGQDALSVVWTIQARG